jgi:hypothetical protein
VRFVLLRTTTGNGARVAHDGEIALEPARIEILGLDIKHPEITAFHGLSGMAFTYANTDIVLTDLRHENGR